MLQPPVLPCSRKVRIDALASVDEVDSYFDRGLSAGSIQELGLSG
jgi:hypothetical protein